MYSYVFDVLIKNFEGLSTSEPNISYLNYGKYKSYYMNSIQDND